MINSVTIINDSGDSVKIDLSHPEKSGFALYSATGLGPGKADLNVSEISSIDGGLFNSARISSRNITLSLIFVEHDGKSIEDVRHDSYRYFQLKKKVSLIFDTDSRLAGIDGYVESNDPTIFSKKEGSDISIVCPSPFFYSAGDNGNTITRFSGVEASFEFPFSNESLSDPLIEFGTIRYDHEKIVVYEGDADVGMRITIHATGDAENVIIYNMETREFMKIDTSKMASYTGHGIIRGDDIIINTVAGSKSVTLIREGVYTNILNCLDRESSWLTLSKGENLFAYSADEGANNLQFQIENRVLYEGV